MDFFQKLFRKKTPVEYSKFDYKEFFLNPEVAGVSLELLSIGDLFLPTGKIVVCDPLVGFERLVPLTRFVAPGKYPVAVCVAKMKEAGDRYAVVKVEFSNSHPDVWELAQTEDGGIKLKDGPIFGFGVDAGLGSFMDVTTQKSYQAFTNDFYTKNPGSNIYDDLFAAEFKKNAKSEKSPGDWLNFHLPNKIGLNVVMFHSGFGDGFYQSYWGLSKNGEVCSLVVDFKVFQP